MLKISNYFNIKDMSNIRNFYNNNIYIIFDNIGIVSQCTTTVGYQIIRASHNKSTVCLKVVRNKCVKCSTMVIFIFIICYTTLEFENRLAT